MTIITSTFELTFFPYRVIPQKMIEQLRMTDSIIQMQESSLKLFECFCDLTGASLQPISAFRKAVLGFAGSLSDTSLVNTSKDTRHKYARFMIDAYNARAVTQPNSSPIRWSPDLPQKQAKAWGDLAIPEYKLSYWRSWAVKTRSEKAKYLPFPALYISHGKEFTEKLHKAIELFFAKQLRPIQTPFNMLFMYLVDNQKTWPVETFDDPERIEFLFEAFMIHFFTRASNLARNISSHKKLWNTFTKNIYECFIDPGIWARPFFSLPRAPSSETRASNTHIKMNKNGVLINTKLMTDIPLFATDGQAIELLFKDISRDVNLIKNWATKQTFQLIKARRNRDAMAERGHKISHPVGRRSIEEIGKENICATFAKHGYRFDRPYLDTHFGTNVLRDDIAILLAIPTKDDIFPFQCLLVANHQQITPSFLENLELYNKNEEMAGFLKTDTGCQLIGFKRRKGRKKALQKINLNAEMIMLVDELIKITTPLRAYLKSQNDDSWRYLFLSAKGSLGRPTRSITVSWNNSRLLNNSSLTALEYQFSPYTDIRGKELFLFLKRVSLTTIRSSCAVADYLQHHSLSLLVKALGHDKFDKKLLSRYLPQVLLDFFQTRWVRIFQCAYVCEAMKDSKYLLRAADFSCMNELHAFLEAHALKEIPESLSEPTPQKVKSKPKHQAYIAISHEILTTLISLEQAVNNSPQPEKITGHAIYWAEFTKLTVSEIESGNDDTLKQHLLAARNNLNSSKMESLIYERP
jgi:hypothetical protein